MSHIAPGTLYYRLETVSGYSSEGMQNVTVEQWAQIRQILGPKPDGTGHGVTEYEKIVAQKK